MKHQSLLELLTTLARHDLSKDDSNQVLVQIYSLLDSGMRHVAKGHLRDKNLVDDALNAALFSIYRGVKGFKGHGSGWKWVKVILINECHSLEDLRSRSKRAREGALHLDLDKWEDGMYQGEFNGGGGEGPDDSRRVHEREGETEKATKRKAKWRKKKKLEDLTNLPIPSLDTSGNGRLPSKDHPC